MVKPITWLPLRDMHNPVRSNLVSPSSYPRFNHEIYPILPFLVCFPASRYRQHLFPCISSLIAGCNSHTYQMPL
jgi:hypothetical protein